MDLLGFDISVYFINLAIAIPVFFILRWLFRKAISEDTLLRAILTWFSTIIVTPLIYVGLVVLFLLYIRYYPTREFNKESWLTETTKRYEMTEDLIKSEILIGKPKNEVQKLLGDDFYKYGDDHWTYDV